MRQLQTLKRGEFDLLVSAIAPKGLKCKVCKIKLTSKNFGFLAKDYCSCDNHNCLRIVVRECEIYDTLRSGELTNHSQQTKPCKSSEVKIIGETRKTAQTLGDKPADNNNKEKTQ